VTDLCMPARAVLLHGKLARGRTTLVDPGADYSLASAHRWTVKEQRRPSGTLSGPYAMTQIDGRTVFLHNLLMGCIGIDHRNRDPLDNRRRNLRKASTAQNGANKPPLAGGSSAFKGVSWDREVSKWQVNIGVDGRARKIGRFTDEVAAARAYDAAALELHGEFAWLNFPAEHGRV
jgi:hypothetical protein